MAMPGEKRPDFERLEDYFRALSYATRLELLHLLRFPRAIADIRIAPRQVRAGENAERPVARQTVQAHLDQLVEIGVVVAQEPATPRAPREYVVNHQRLYQILEEFRAVGTMLSVGAPAFDDATADLERREEGALPPGPKLVLAHGLREGKSFLLRREASRWIIGRRLGVDVCLEYDPYVSLENAEVARQDGALLLRDLHSSKNGTWLNWRRLAEGEQRAIRPGDIVGVGRSLLVYMPE